MILSYKFRVKDATTGKHMRRYSTACNQVWNYLVALQRKVQDDRRGGRNVLWPTAFDCIKLTTGCAADLGLHSDTVSALCRQFVASRNLHKRCPRFRASFGAKRALGWVPIIARSVKVEGDRATYLKRKFYFWKSRDIEGIAKCGSFVEDARGRWYVCFQQKIAEDRPTGNGEIGIDLGLKTLAVCSDGTEVPALRHYRKYEAALAVAQRANNHARVKAIHAKIANSRRHHLHEQSTRIARENSFIVVGKVNAAKLAKTRMAKSVLDAGWSTFRNMLAYKARRHRARFIEADERWTSATCSDCGAVSGPKGIAGLQVRHWNCPCCEASHDRDVNAARNILRVGRERSPLVGEIPVL